jgi:formylglycine-generating enzyme required for sulfatase activity
MGSPSDELGREAGNEMLHRVTLQADFQMKATEVTWAEWNSVRDLGTAYGYTDLPDGLNGVGGDESGQHPVVGITWWDAIKWCNLMSQRDGKKPVYYVNSTLTSILKSGVPPVPAPHVDWKANGYRLPTEAEWEFACRAGLRKREFHTGSIRDLGKDPNLDKAGWYGGNGTHPVGSKTANQLGLYDMHGNAAEWCWDYFGLLKQADAFDPKGAPQGVFRVVRGGSWKDPVKDCRAAARAHLAPALSNRFVGFRWVCAVPAR